MEIWGNSKVEFRGEIINEFRRGTLSHSADFLQREIARDDQCMEKHWQISKAKSERVGWIKNPIRQYREKIHSWKKIEDAETKNEKSRKC